MQVGLAAGAGPVGTGRDGDVGIVCSRSMARRWCSRATTARPLRATPFRRCCSRYGVAWLPSPPRMPRYNGGCEAGNGSLRKRTDHFARRAGRWTSECLEAACRQANELLRPQGHRGPTHRERWSARQPIDPQVRERFARRGRTPSASDPRRAQDTFQSEKQKPSTSSATSGRRSSTPRTRPVNHHPEVNSSTN